MSAFIKSFVDDYLADVQKIPWYSDEELEEILEIAKTSIEQQLKDNGVEWVLSKSIYADDIEKMVTLLMACTALLAISDDNLRSEKISKYKNLEGTMSEGFRLTLKSRYDSCSEELAKLTEKFISLAEESP